MIMAHFYTPSHTSCQGQRSLVAFNLCCLEDLNEITSHMLEVVQAHMQHNRNPCGGNLGDGDASTYGLSASQSQVSSLVLQHI